VTARPRLCIALQLLAATGLGILVGASIAEGALLVTWWRAIPPTEFLAWYAANAARLLGFFAPLTAVATGLAVVSALVSAGTCDAGRRPAAVAAALTVLVVAGFFLYFEDANARFASGRLTAGEVPVALARWAAWHWVRVAVMLVAFGAALAALVRRDGR
jgi:hypothetical protein